MKQQAKKLANIYQNVIVLPGTLNIRVLADPWLYHDRMQDGLQMKNNERIAYSMKKVLALFSIVQYYADVIVDYSVLGQFYNEGRYEICVSPIKCRWLVGIMRALVNF